MGQETGESVNDFLKNVYPEFHKEMVLEKINDFHYKMNAIWAKNRIRPSIAIVAL
jgi:hypothetical protein